jgi:DNA-binding NarL/FixJ family response regulator
MGQRGVHHGDVDDSEAIDRQLEAIESALIAGDLRAAQEHLRAFRRRIRGGTDRDDHVHATLLGGAMLTGQETATLRLLPDGSLSQKDIARTMGVTRNTLKTHLKSLYLKLGVHCRSEAIHRAREVGLLPRPISVTALRTDNLIDVA